MKQTLKIIAVSGLAAAAVIKAVPAFAEQALAQNIAIVHTNDLDLSSAKGRAELDHRLVNAVNDVCGTASDFDLAGKNAVRACRINILARARATYEQLASREGPILLFAHR
jgi:UrcA family protein